MAAIVAARTTTMRFTPGVGVFSRPASIRDSIRLACNSTPAIFPKGVAWKSLKGSSDRGPMTTTLSLNRAPLRITEPAQRSGRNRFSIGRIGE